MLDVPTAHALLRRTRPRHSRDGYPAEVRAQVTALAAAEVGQGRKLTATARRLGLHPSTLERWLDADPELPPTFVPVICSVVGDRRAPPAPSPLAVVTPSGHRVEGLDLDGVVTLLRRLS